MINLRKSTERALQNSPFEHKRSLVGVIFWLFSRQSYK